MDNNELLDNYFEGTLSADEREVFDRLLREDTEFAAAFAFHRDIQKTITVNERQKLKGKFQAYERRSIRLKKRLQWTAIAASVLVVASLSLWLGLRPNQYDRLYAQHYQTYPNTIAPTVRGQQAEAIQAEAFYAYDNGQYDRALDHFSEIYQQDEADYALFYQGVCLMELGRFKEAIAVFGDYPSEGPFASYAIWYRALSHLKEKDTPHAAQLLETLAATKHPLRAQAELLLTAIK